MKNKTKYLTFIFILFAIVGSLASCSSSGYSLDKFVVSVATVHPDKSGYANSFTLDDGTTLFVAAQGGVYYKPENERVVVNYTLLGENYESYDYAIRLNGYHEDVLTKPVIYIAPNDIKKQDSIGYNQIKVLSIWAKQDYITIRFGYNMGGKDAHMLNLVSPIEDKTQNGEEPIKLEFRHNIGDDEENYGSRAMHVSFKLKDYIAANAEKEKIDFEVSWEEYDGTVKKEKIVYTLLENEKEPVPPAEEKK